jgi:hypothetical protein
MHPFKDVLHRTWLATTLFVAASATMWCLWMDWEEVGRHLPWTLFVSPVIWWFAVGRHRRPHLLRGIAAGALTGLSTQLVLPHWPRLWELLSHRGEGDGDAQIAAAASMVVYLMIGAVALLMGALIGLLATAIERRMSEAPNS